MKRRDAYIEFEQRIVKMYNQHTLTLEKLDLLAGQYALSGIDTAGSRRLRALDGKDLLQICIALVHPAFPLVSGGSSSDDDEYWERELQIWEEIVRERWSLPAPCYQFTMQEEYAA